jgi:hypothetical protein
MRTYTDDHIRAVLEVMVLSSSYRKTAAALGVDHAQLQRIVTGVNPLTDNVALALGFIPAARAWTETTQPKKG